MIARHRSELIDWHNLNISGIIEVSAQFGAPLGCEGSFQREATVRSHRERPADRRCNEARGISRPPGTGARRQRQSVTQLGEASLRSAGRGCFDGCCGGGNIGFCSGGFSVADCAAARHAGSAIIGRNATDGVSAEWCAA